MDEVTETWGHHQQTPGPLFLLARPPRRAHVETHMMKAVTPMAQMSVCVTAPWPSRSSGAGDGTGGGHGLFAVEGAGGQDWGLLPAHPSPRSGLVSAPCAPMVSM